MKSATLGLLVAALPCMAHACLPGFEGAAQAKGGPYVVAFRTDPVSIRGSQFFALDIAVCPAVAEIKVDAHMPAHRHGMNYHPTVSTVAPGRFRAEGLMLHMPGAWEFVFDVSGPEGRQRIAWPYQLR